MVFLTGWTDDYIRKELPVRRFFSLSRLLPSLEANQRGNKLYGMALAFASIMSSGKKGSDAFHKHLLELGEPLKEYKLKNKRGETILVKDKDGKERTVYKRAIVGGEITPQEAVQMFNPGSGEARFGVRGPIRKA